MFINNYKFADFQALLDSLNKALAVPFNSPLKSFEKAGEGNMNYTYRLILESAQSIVVKQSPPFCAKFPDIAAPQQRIGYESQFYTLLNQQAQIKDHFPNLIYFNPVDHILFMEDLGNANDFNHLYPGGTLSLAQAKQVVQTLSAINSVSLNQPIENKGMRTLNHAHIFDIPLTRNNGLDLDSITEGLDVSAKKLIANAQYKKLAYELGQEYLSTGSYLLHGDYYPGSWLACKNNIAVIDPEFCFSGAIEFDLGVLLAHLTLSQQSAEVVSIVLDNYQPTKSIDFDFALMFCGIEIMRRLIGYAQLPLNLSAAEKQLMLDKSLELVTSPNKQILL